MRAYRLLSLFGALTMIGLVATLVVHGGWQAVAAGFAAVNGVGFVLTFLVIDASMDRPRPA